MTKPELAVAADNVISAKHLHMGNYLLRTEGSPTLVFCENETNFERLYSVPNPSPYRKDGIHEWLTGKNANAVNPGEKPHQIWVAYYQLVVDGPCQQDCPLGFPGRVVRISATLIKS